jgi:hypothetical protein
VRLLYIALIVLRYWDSEKDHTEMIELQEVADSLNALGEYQGPVF